MKKQLLSLMCTLAMLAFCAYALPPTPAHDSKSRTLQTRPSIDKPLEKVKKGGNVRLPLKSSSLMNDAVPVPGKIAPRMTPAQTGIPDIYGCLITYDGAPDGVVGGLWKIPVSSSQNRTLIADGMKATDGGTICNGVYYSFCQWEFYGMINAILMGHNISTGMQEYYYVGWYEPQYIPCGDVATDPLTGKVTGIFHNSSDDGYELVCLDYPIDPDDNETPPARTVLTPVNGFPEGGINAFGITSAGICYAIGNEGFIYYLDRSSGYMTIVAGTGFTPAHAGGATVDPTTNMMYWWCPGTNGSSTLVQIDLTTYESTALYTDPTGAEYCGLCLPPAQVGDDLPGKCTDIIPSFTDGSLSGSVSVHAPATLADGTEGTGNLTVTVSAGETTLTPVQCAWGATVEIPLSLSSPGMYTISAYATNENGDGQRESIDPLWIGADTPKTPIVTAELTGNVISLNWETVQEGAHGGWIDASDVTYKISDKSGATVAQNLTDTSWSYTVTDTETLTEWQYAVTATSGGIVSEPGYSNRVFSGAATLPYIADFAGDGLSGYTILNSNGDDRTWEVSGDEACIKYNVDLAMDDWLISPPLKLKSGEAYLVTFDVYGRNALHTEKVEVKWGNTPKASAMTGTLLEPTSVKRDRQDPCHVSTYLIPEADGTYYIGFHAISNPDSYYLHMSGFKVDLPMSAYKPQAPGNMTVTPAENGDLSAEITFTAPDKNITGGELESLESITVMNGVRLVKTILSPLPGTTYTAMDNQASAGDVEYSVFATNSYGEGLKATGACFIGLDRPMSVAEVHLRGTDEPGIAHISWGPVTNDVRGKSLPTGGVTYNVYKPNSSVPIATGITDPWYETRAVAPGSQNFVQYVVTAVCRDLESDAMGSHLVPIGTPFHGLHETGAQIKYPWGADETGGAKWQIYPAADLGIEAADHDGTLFGCYAQIQGQSGALSSGLVSLAGMENPGLQFYTYNLYNDETGPDLNGLIVRVRPDQSNEWVELTAKTVSEICNGATGETWGKLSVSLDEFDGQTLQFRFIGLAQSYQFTLLDGIRVGELHDVDLALVTPSATSQAKGGEEYEVTALVVNNGITSSPAFKLNLYADGKLVKSADQAPLDGGAERHVTLSAEMSALVADKLTVWMEAECLSDGDDTNNSTPWLYVQRVASTLPAPAGLQAESDGENLHLSWSEPDYSDGHAEPVTEDFETATAWADNFSDWTFHDADNMPLGNFAQYEAPCIQIGKTTGSFWVWDVAELGNSTFAAHSGTKYLFSMFRADDGLTDDWAISPELDGLSQTVSFYAKSYSPQYPERIEVWYSESDTDVSDFLPISSACWTVPDAWTKYMVTLPAGAKHFAIRSHSTASFMLMIDDVAYVGKGIQRTPLTLTGYNLYRNGVKLNDTPLADIIYRDQNAPKGENHTYHVTAMYKDHGESMPSDPVEIKHVSSANCIRNGFNVTVADGQLMISGTEGAPVSVFNSQGVCVYHGSGDAKVHLGSGMYVVICVNRHKKVIL